jgi:Cu(I)/Ag(I) efflux system membrane fusion protein
MKTLRFIFLGFVAFGLVSAGCRRAATNDKPADVDYYTCTMHPSVKSQDPKAKCPICSMDLVPVKKAGAAQSNDEHSSDDHAAMPAEKAADSSMAGMAMPSGGEKIPAEEMPREFTVPLDRQQLIGVTYAKVEKTPLKTTVRAVGTVALDRLRHWDYVSRVEGYVQKLAVSARGESVKLGQPLLTLYSPDLLATQREFIEALRIRDDARESGLAENIASADRLVGAARRRLALWNLGEPQLEALEKSRLAQDTLTLSSPFDGVVLELMTNQGSRVVPGDHLVDVADLSVVWIWAEFYQEELPLVRPGAMVAISTSAYPNEKLTGKIALVDPFLNEAKRTGRVRIDVDNPQTKLRPDMYVNVELELDLGEGLTVPVSAVLPTGERNIAFVDKGEGRLEPRFVEVGRKVGDRYVVTNGLAEGDRIVTSANFLIDAEAKVQGALKSW